jgi:hypothetical protein
VQPDHNRAHGSSLGLAQALIEAALQGKLGNALFLLDHGAHLKETIGGAYILVAGSITTTDGNLLLGFLNDFKVVGDEGADFVVVCEELLAAPQVRGSFGTLIFVGQVGALDNVA